MEVDSSVDPKPFKGAGEGKEETYEIKWVALDEAMELLEDEYEGKHQEKADRDIQAIRQGHREWEGRNKRASFHAAIKKEATKISVDAQQAHSQLGDYFAENGKFPDDLREDPYYVSLLAEIGKETFTPTTSSTSTYTMLKGLMGNYLKKMDIEKGLFGAATFSNLQQSFASNWGSNAMLTSVHTNIVAHAIAEIRGFPESWMFGTAVPEDLDSSGRPMFRSDNLRDEMIKAYDAFESGKTDGKGFFSNGEKYDFNKMHPVKYKQLVNGKPTEITEENHWNLVMGRAKAVQKIKSGKYLGGLSGDSKKSWKAHTSAVYLEYAESYLKSQDKEDLFNELKEKGLKGKKELIEHGKEFVREYAKTAQNITQGLLKAALPKGVHHIYTLRHVGSAREVAGDYGIDGSTPAGLESLPNSSSEKAGGEGMKQIVHSGVLAGGSVNPLSWTNDYTVFRRTNVRDIFMIQALWNPGHEGERELIVVNNPNSEARVVRRKGDIWNAETWDMAPDRNGMFPEGVFEHKGKRWGITSPSTDFKNTLVPATSKDNPMISEHEGGQLGTNAGKLMKDPETNKQFYVKYSAEDGKNASEDLANKLYEAADIAVPHTEMVRWENGHALKSDWIDDTVHHGTSDGTLSGTPSAELINRPDIKHGFLVDAVLANWDVAGAGTEKPYGNLMEKDGKIIRIDQGGALAYKGLSGQKGGNGSTFWSGHTKHQENDFLDEIDTLRDENINPTTAHIFQGMTEDDWDSASSNLMKLTNSRIEDIVNDSAILATDKNKMIDTLKARRDAALKWWISNPQLVGQTGYNSIEDLHSKSNLLKQDLFKAVNKELEAHKNQPMLWLDEEGHNERLMRTEEEQISAEKGFEFANQLRANLKSKSN